MTARRILTALLLTASLTLGAHTTADAASLNKWERVAKCESGGNWKINTGNGYYGGLQISARTWKAYGGKKYASNAHRTSKTKQIKIAEKILKGQGWGAWGACGRR